ncbi:hypothetical protein LCGC14_0396840 [marine sediment metagenome]|uniref:Uncharacterized protein n=1 Tax=marine sediment metagenome TaxID=412755 RepID=A0A0F9TG74_9ZZZZ
MKLLLEKLQVVWGSSPVELEKVFGLKRGDISEVTWGSGDNVEIKTSLYLSTNQKKAIETKLGMRIISEE